jgi:hypothetical protein
MNIIWYLYEDTNWYKLKYLPEISGLNDMFEFQNDYNYAGMKTKKGMTLDMYYGCMESLIKKGELLTEKEYKKL